MILSKFKGTDSLWWAIAAVLGLISVWLPVVLEFGTTPVGTLIISHAGLMLIGAVIGYCKPERPWRWGIGSVLLFPLVEFVGIATGRLPQDSTSLAESLPYLIVKIPVYALQALPALVGAYLAAFARLGMPTWDWTSRNVRLWGFAFLLGFVAGGVSLLLAQLLSNKMDPFDLWISYILWGASLFLSAVCLSLSEPYRAWRWAIAVSLGLPIAVLLQIILDIFHARARHNLWPLEVFVSLLVAVPTSFAGAYFGVLTRWISGKLRQPKV